MSKGPQDVRFEIDHMLIKLGKYLRILGYDAEWDLRLRTHELIAAANRESRVFITRNTQLPDRYPPPRECIVLVEEDPADQLRAVAARLDLDTRQGLFSKCVRCNVLLDALADKETIRDRVHANVFARYERFHACPRCGTVFWHGSHVRNTCRKLGLEPPSV